MQQKKKSLRMIPWVVVFTNFNYTDLSFFFFSMIKKEAFFYTFTNANLGIEAAFFMPTKRPSGKSTCMLDRNQRKTVINQDFHCSNQALITKFLMIFLYECTNDDNYSGHKLKVKALMHTKKSRTPSLIISLFYFP